MNSKLERTLPVILSVLGSAGVVGTSILVAKSTLDNKEKLEELKGCKSKKKVIIDTIKIYKWPLATGAATIASIVAGTIISKKVEASLSATAIMLDTALRKYKHKAKELLGEKAQEITKAIAKDDFKDLKEESKKIEPTDRRKLYYEEHIGFFKALPEDLKEAVHITNEKILSSYDGPEVTVTDHWASLNTFLEDCHGDLVPEDNIDLESFDYGWTAEYMAYTYGEDIFLHINETPHLDASGNEMYTIIEFDKEPCFGIHSDYINWPNPKLDEYNAKDLDSIEDNYYKEK